MNRPSAAVAANRRRVLLWIPLIIIGALAGIATGATINSLHLIGMALIAAGGFGFISEIGK